MNVLLTLLFTPLEVRRHWRLPMCLSAPLENFSLTGRVGLLTGFIFASFLWGWSTQPLFAVTSTGSVTITGIVPGCGDGVIQTGESCDGSNLNNQICSSQGFSGGTLSCNSNCTFNTSQCTSAPSGGGGGGYVSPPETKVIFSGRAYPKSAVTLLKDAQIAATTIAGADANFQIGVSNLSGGNYIFSVYSEDSSGIRSSLLSFPVSVVSGAIVNIGGIFVAPTIAVDKNEVKMGENIAIFGQSIPKAEITIVVNSDEEFFNKTLADASGAYLYNLDTIQLKIGQHFTKSKATLDGAISSFSKAIGFAVGAKNIIAELPEAIVKGDLNGDKRVNLIDFSIVAYWYKRTISAEFVVKEKERLNGDGKVDLIDFSIMAFYWTG